MIESRRDALRGITGMVLMFLGTFAWGLLWTLSALVALVFPAASNGLVRLADRLEDWLRTVDPLP